MVLSAELAGETATGSFALRLMPLDPSHIPELTAITESDEADIPPSRGPMSALAARAMMKPIPDPEPEDVDEDELDASVLFDPEAALISRAPARPEVTGPEDTLTIPVRASMMPADVGALPPSARSASPPRRPPSGPHTISHLSIPSIEPATERQEPSISITVDFDTSQSNVHTEREGPEWNADDDGPGAADASLGESVVFDPDVLAREQGTGGAGGQKPSQPPSLRREPSVRLHPVDLDEPVNEDAETFPRSSGRHPVAPSEGTLSSEAGPRTMRRNTGAHGIVIVGRVIANRYRIESLVGAGAIGAVYKASHVDLPRTFAIKVLHPHFRADPQLLASFRTEARAASLLDHPNVTVVHDFGEEPDGLVYIVMEYLAGVNLQAVLDDERRIGPRRAIAIITQVCGALSAAHERGIVHRDVKPDNIMLVPSRDDEGRPFEMVKVCDFGIAALETSGQGGPSREWTAGTPEYMAPEQARGHADARTDVYAVGIVLYEMLTGRPPFVGDSPAATLAKHATELPRRPSEIVAGFPPPLEAVILRAIEKSPARRFSSMRDLRAELKRLL